MIKLDISAKDITVAILVAIAIIFCLTFFNGASADSPPKSKYQALEENLNIEYQAAKIHCQSLLTSAQDLCISKAEEAKDFAMARLQRENEKIGEIKKDEAVESKDFNDEKTLYKTNEFNHVYHVNA